MQVCAHKIIFYSLLEDSCLMCYVNNELRLYIFIKTFKFQFKKDLGPRPSQAENDHWLCVVT